MKPTKITLGHLKKKPDNRNNKKGASEKTQSAKSGTPASKELMFM